MQKSVRYAIEWCKRNTNKGYGFEVTVAESGHNYYLTIEELKTVFEKYGEWCDQNVEYVGRRQWFITESVYNDYNMN